MPKIRNPLPQANNVGVRYPRWHAKHPNNAVAVPASVAPTIPKNK